MCPNKRAKDNCFTFAKHMRKYFFSTTLVSTHKTWHCSASKHYVEDAFIAFAAIQTVLKVVKYAVNCEIQSILNICLHCLCLCQCIDIYQDINMSRPCYVYPLRSPPDHLSILSTTYHENLKEFISSGDHPSVNC